MPNHVIEADFVPLHSSLIPDPESETSSGENGAAKCFIIKILLWFYKKDERRKWRHELRLLFSTHLSLPILLLV